MESAAKIVRELNLLAFDLLSTTRPTTTTGQNPVNQVGDNTASRTPNLDVHYTSSCKHKETVYKKCRKAGHLQKVCRSKQSKPTRKPHKTINNVQDDATNKCHYIPKKAIPWKLSDDIEGIILSMKLNTGASKSLMSERKFRVL